MEKHDSVLSTRWGRIKVRIGTIRYFFKHPYLFKYAFLGFRRRIIMKIRHQNRFL